MSESVNVAEGVEEDPKVKEEAPLAGQTQSSSNLNCIVNDVASNESKALADVHEQQSAERYLKRRKQDGKRTAPNIREVSNVFSAVTSSYLPNLATNPWSYGSLLASLEMGNGSSSAAVNPYMAAGGFDMSFLSAGGGVGGEGARAQGSNAKRSDHDLLNKNLLQVDLAAIRQLIVGYRDAAALLSRTADELELFAAASSKH